MKYLYLTLYLFCLGLTALAQDSDFPEKPNRLVNDYADMLTAQEEQALEQKLRGYADTTSTQIAVVLMTSIGGYDINQYAAELGERWGVGGGNYDNGLVIMVAKEERKVAIQTGYGLEEYIPDAIAKRLTERVLKPAFQQGQFYQGINQATDLVFELASGAYQADPSQLSDGGGSGPSILFIVVAVIVVVVILSRLGGGGGRGGGRRYSRTFGGPVIVPGGFGTFRSGGGMFGGGGGGGFGGFGGGSFGGGGASSSW